MSRIGKNRKKRGVRWQVEKREMERGIRKDTITFVRWQARCGRLHEEIARALGISHVTLADWKRRWRGTRLRAHDRGRPLSRPDVATRNHVISLFRLWGPGVGLPALKKEFPAVARRELVDIQRRYRSLCRKKKAMHVHTLRWTRPGTVWAIDYTEPPCPVDGIYSHLLLVRDLASGKQLRAQPLIAQNANHTTQLLQALFLQHSPPLVIKMDNGSPLVADEVMALLAAHGVLPLLSPPYMPRYNGACEAGIGSIKLRAHLESARHDRPGIWTCDDIEAARLMANETARPRGYTSPTPDEAWDAREHITPDLREAFIRTYEQFESEARQDAGLQPDGDLGPRKRAMVDRAAIPRALVAHGFLFYRRRRISLRLKKRFWRKIS